MARRVVSSDRKETSEAYGSLRPPSRYISNLVDIIFPTILEPAKGQMAYMRRNSHFFTHADVRQAELEQLIAKALNDAVTETMWFVLRFVLQIGLPVDAGAYFFTWLWNEIDR
jgi:hypothetical protein